MVAMMIGTVFHAFWLHYFIITKELGTTGAAYANTVTNSILFVSLTTVSHLVPRLR